VNLSDFRLGSKPTLDRGNASPSGAFFVYSTVQTHYELHRFKTNPTARSAHVLNLDDQRYCQSTCPVKIVKMMRKMNRSSEWRRRERTIPGTVCSWDIHVEQTKSSECVNVGHDSCFAKSNTGLCLFTLKRSVFHSVAYHGTLIRNGTTRGSSSSLLAQGRITSALAGMSRVSY
jgi:hypothetical protein